MTPTQFILTAVIVLIIALVAYIAGYRNGREEEREEGKIAKRQRARRLVVVRTASAFCPERKAGHTQGGLQAQNSAEWFTPRIV